MSMKKMSLSLALGALGGVFSSVVFLAPLAAADPPNCTRPTSCAIAPPRATPINPPSRLSTAASTKN